MGGLPIPPDAELLEFLGLEDDASNDGAGHGGSARAPERIVRGDADRGVAFVGALPVESEDPSDSRMGGGVAAQGAFP